MREYCVVIVGNANAALRWRRFNVRERLISNPNLNCGIVTWIGIYDIIAKTVKLLKGNGELNCNGGDFHFIRLIKIHQDVKAGGDCYG